MRKLVLAVACWTCVALARRIQTAFEEHRRVYEPKAWIERRSSRSENVLAELLFAPITSSGASGWRVAGHRAFEHFPSLRMQSSSDDELSEESSSPSDIESSDSNGEAAKERLKVEIAEGLASPKASKAAIGEILVMLEGHNPTPTPVTSPLLNGKWKLVYASGASPGLQAFQVLLKGSVLAPKSPSGADLVDIGDVYITISPEQPRATSELNIRLLSFENTIKLESKLEVESEARLTETYDSAQSVYANLRLPFQSPLAYKRSVLVTYLDDELLVVRDEDGRPDVLMRVDTLAGGIDDFRNTVEDIPGASS